MNRWKSSFLPVSIGESHGPTETERGTLEVFYIELHQVILMKVCVL